MSTQQEVVMAQAPTKDAAELRLLNIVYSCWICHDTFEQVYATRDDTKGFTDGHIPHQCHVTKLYLTDCRHVICAKHFANGGQGQRAHESCPYCVKTTGDARLKKLFGVTGFEVGQYDEEVPETYLFAPPEAFQLSRADGPTTFQYAALGHWATATAAKVCEEAKRLKQSEYDLQHTKLQLEFTEREFKDQEETLQKLQNEVATLKAVVKQGEDAVNQLELYKERGNDNPEFSLFDALFEVAKEKEKEIGELKHFLSGIADYREHLADTNHALEYGTWLESKLPELKTAFQVLGRPFPAMTFEEWKRENPPKRPAPSQTPTRKLDLDALRNEYQALSSHPPGSPPRKKPRRQGMVGFPPTSQSDSTLEMRPLSSELMPPPPLPFQRTQQFSSLQGVDDPRTPKGHSAALSGYDHDEEMSDCGTGSGQYHTLPQQSVPGFASLPGREQGSPFGSAHLNPGPSPDRLARSSMYVPGGGGPFASQGALTGPDRRHSSVVSPSYMNLLNRVGDLNDLNLNLRDPRPEHQIAVGLGESHQRSGMITPDITPAQQHDTPRKRFTFARPLFRQSSSRKSNSESVDIGGATQAQAGTSSVGTFTFGVSSPPAPVTPTPRQSRRESVRKILRKFRIN